MADAAPVRVVRRLREAPGALPVPLTSFVGRERELAALLPALATTRLLTLTGPGGGGKTRLALRAATEQLDRFPDGVWWVELGSLHHAGLVGSAIAGTLGVRPPPGVTDTQAVCAFLAPRHALLVLDNCEHLVGACAEVVTAILTTAPHTTVLATSRSTLGVAGETDWRVPPLSLPEAVTLFTERARRARPGFAATDQVAAVCERLDGLPLAIELAAARVRTLSLEQLAQRLSDRFALLNHGPRTALARQQTLRASVDWSHDLLSDAEQRLLRRVAVFTGGFTLEAAEAVVGDGDLVDTLDALVDHSLVLAEPGAHAMRYRLLETVRAYALERLTAAGEEALIQARHRDVFLARAVEAGPHLESSRQAEWLARLDPEAANLAAAFEHAIRTDPEGALRMCAALYRFWRARGRFAEAARAQALALDAGSDAPAALRACVLVTRALRCVLQADLEAAGVHATEALALAEQAGDPGTAARARCAIGDALQFTRPGLAGTEFMRAAELARAADDPWALIQARQVPAFGSMLLSEHARSARLNDEVAALADRHGEPYQVSRRWFLAAWMAVNDGRLAEARVAIDRARAAVADVWEPIPQAATDGIEAQIHVWCGQPERALERLPRQLERAGQLGATLMVPFLMGTLGFAELAAGRLPDSRIRLERLAALAEGRSPYAAAWALNFLAETQRLLGDDDAQATAARAQAIAERFGNRLLATRARLTLARLAAARADWTTAHQHALAHLDACAEGGHETWAPGGFDALAEIAAGLDQYDDAARLFAAAARARADLGIVRVIPEPGHWAAVEARVRDAAGAEATAQGAGLTLADALAWTRRSRGARTRATTGWPALSPTELRVAELVAQGLSNPEIGARMFISRETVKTHLGHVFAKVGVRNRAELAALAGRRVSDG